VKSEFKVSPAAAAGELSRSARKQLKMTMPEKRANQFVSYAFKDLSHKKVRKYAAQYDGVDMATLMGADEDNFPFLVNDRNGGYDIYWWTTHSGIMTQIDEDSVRAFATMTYLLEHAYPRFESIEDAEEWAKSHEWPSKNLGR